jgi:hypothetical protein
MIVTKSNSRLLQTTVLVLAVVALSIGAAQAKHCSDKKTDACAEKTKKKCGVGANKDAYLTKIWSVLQAQVKQGDLTAEDAKIMMIAVKKKYAKKTKTDDHLKKVWAKLQAEVKAGNMTAEQAEAKMIAIKKKKGCDKKAKTDTCSKKEKAPVKTQCDKHKH